jgi:hypothetical protein
MLIASHGCASADARVLRHALAALDLILDPLICALKRA